ncbi:MAG: right-handed parallel beta-helix repeat-containing protein [Blastocatellia bacterium]
MNMKKIKLALNIAAIFAVCLFCSSVAQAQACRTWVSALGNDADPCSRTAPCKTFSGAISKTAEGGEIDVLDPGGYGTLTIGKSLTVDGGTGSGWASVLASGANGFIVNVTTNPTTAVVILRHISLNGTRNGTVCADGLNGIRYLAGSKLIVDDCQIFGFSQKAIDVNLLATGSLAVYNTYIEDCFDGIVMTNNGGTMKGVVTNSKITMTNNSALNLLSGSATISNSVVSNNASFGVISQGGAAINVTNTVLSHNGTALSTAAAASSLRISNNDILNNTTGLSNTGTTTSTQNNRFFGNTADLAGGAIVNCPTCVK